MSSIKNIVFLDIDGVLVKESSTLSPSYSFDPDCLAKFEASILYLLSLNIPCYIVITSSWREVFSLDFIKSRFSLSIQPLILGSTPLYVENSSHFFRFDECLYFLTSLSLNIDSINWLAIDDIPEHYPPSVRSNVLSTDPLKGFSFFHSSFLIDFFLQYF